MRGMRFVAVCAHARLENATPHMRLENATPHISPRFPAGYNLASATTTRRSLPDEDLPDACGCRSSPRLWAPRTRATMISSPHCRQTTADSEVSRRAALTTYGAEVFHTRPMMADTHWLRSVRLRLYQCRHPPNDQETCFRLVVSLPPSLVLSHPFF